MPGPLSPEELDALLNFEAERARSRRRKKRTTGNRRRFRRFECQLWGQVQLEGGAPFRGRITSISLGGFFVEGEVEASGGEAVEFEIALPKTQSSFKARGRVVYGRRLRDEGGPGLGVQFDALTPADVWALLSNFHLLLPEES